jgi:peptidoglycan/LPS O-acetylase OafA/YrhL
VTHASADRQPDDPSHARLTSLDVLRFIAAMSVVLYHYTYRRGAEGAAAPLSGLQAVTMHGYLGVDLFFIISGFVVLWSARDRAPRDFVRSRALRLFPEFWISVLLSAAVFSLFTNITVREMGLGMTLLNLTMIPQYFGAPYVDGVYWTLGVELKFYGLLWLLLCFKQLSRIELWLFVWLALAAAVFAFELDGPLASLVIHPFGPLFIAGGLFYLVFDSWWRPRRVAAIVVCLALGTYQAIKQMPGFVDPVHITAVTRTVTALVLGGCFGLFALVANGSVNSGDSRLALSLGALTYPLYLLHNVGKVLFVSAAAALPGALEVVLGIVFSIGLSLAVARLSGRFVKPPLRTALSAILGPDRRSAVD